jgi:SanA protein
MFSRLMRLSLLAAALVAGVWLVCELAVEIAAWGRTYDRLANVPKREFGLVLGTSKYIAGNHPNLHYQYRIEAAAALYKAGKVQRLIVSGNGIGPYYNEPRMMREDLVARGVPDDRIISDEAGLRTYDSVVRAAKVFHAADCIVVSQRAHNERAIFIGRARGQDIVGWNARDVGMTIDPRTAVRERLARVLAVIDVLDAAIWHHGPAATPGGKALSSGALSR